MELKSPEARKSQREKRHTKKAKEIIFPIYSVQTLDDLANIIEVIYRKTRTRREDSDTTTEIYRSLDMFMIAAWLYTLSTHLCFDTLGLYLQNNEQDEAKQLLAAFVSLYAE